jgi:hypothetical protein
MARRTKQQNDEIVRVFYGINEALEVDSVSLTRGGTLSKWGKDSNYHYHHVEKSRDARAEAALVFHLRDLIEIIPLLAESEHCKKQIAELEEKAKKMREEREAAAKAKKSTD